MLFLSTALGATSEDSAAQTDPVASEVPEEECYCSVRKRKQVEKRLEKKKQAEQGQAEVN
jgi:Skp family chaperone for outer membrane proteins